MAGGLCSEKAVQGEKSDELLLASSEDLGSLEVIAVVVVDGSAIVASITTASVHIDGHGMHAHRRCFHHHCLGSHTWIWHARSSSLRPSPLLLFTYMDMALPRVC